MTFIYDFCIFELVMTTGFESYVRSQTQLSEADINKISSLAVSHSLRRNEHLLKAGEVCRHKVFVSSGLLRTYSLGADGSEAILQFSPELSWTLDVESYDQQTPSVYNIAAVENSEVLLWHKSDFQNLLENLPELKRYADVLIARNIYNSRHRLAAALNATPEEKYEGFIRNSPELLSRLPLRMIAAYLGISIKTLTRIRYSQLQRL